MKDDERGVSAVLGTILMIAITVMVAATIYAVVGNFGASSVKEPVNAVFKVQTVDNDFDLKDDGVKFTYMSGPGTLTTDQVRISIRSLAGAEIASVTRATWNVTDFATWSPTTAQCSSPPCSFTAVVSVLGTPVVPEQIVRVHEVN